MSTLRDYFGISDSDYRRNLYWNYTTNKFYIRNVGFNPPNPKQCILLGKWD